MILNMIRETSIWPGEFVTEDINYEKGTEKLSIEELTLLNKKLYEVNKSFKN